MTGTASRSLDSESKVVIRPPAQEAATCDRCPPACARRCSAAAELFADRGLDATKMEDIAAATGVPKATLYYYFEGKEDILAFLFAEILDEVAAGRRATPSRPRARPPTGCGRCVVAHLRVFEALPRRQPGPPVRPGPGRPHPADRRADRVRLPRAGAAAARGRAPTTAACGPSSTPRLVAVAILGAVTTVGINAIALGPRRVRPTTSPTTWSASCSEGWRRDRPRWSSAVRSGIGAAVVARQRARGRSTSWCGTSTAAPTSRATSPTPTRSTPPRPPRSTRLGVPDLVTVTAGDRPRRHAASTSPADDWDRVVGTNAKGVWLAMRALAAPDARRRRRLDRGHQQRERPPGRPLDGPLLRVEGGPRHGRSRWRPLEWAPTRAGERGGPRRHRHADARAGARGTGAGSAAWPTAPPSAAWAPPTTSPRRSSPSTAWRG